MRTAVPLSSKAIVLGFAAASLVFAAGASRAEQQTQVDRQRLYSDGLSARELIDTPVRGEQGERIGDVKDIVVDDYAELGRRSRYAGTETPAG